MEIEWGHLCKNSKLNSLVAYQQNQISFSSHQLIHIPLGTCSLLWIPLMGYLFDYAVSQIHIHPSTLCSLKLQVRKYDLHFPDSFATWIPLRLCQNEGIEADWNAGRGENFILFSCFSISIALPLQFTQAAAVQSSRGNSLQFSRSYRAPTANLSSPSKVSARAWWGSFLSSKHTLYRGPL